MTSTFQDIPKTYSIKTPLHQKTYLVNGKLKKWEGESAKVYSSISSTPKYQKTCLGTIPQLGEKEALEALNSATLAYKVKDFGPP